MYTEQSCKCGNVEIIIRGKPVVELCCHCEDCRASTGKPFTNLAFFKLEHLAIAGRVSAKEFVADSGNKTRRESCKSCGVMLFDKSDGFPTLVGLMVDNIDYPFEFTPSCHVWTSSKLPAVNIPTGIKCYEKGIEKP